MAARKFPTPVTASLETIQSPELKQIHPEDYNHGFESVKGPGDYHSSPYGRTKYWIFGPEDGQKVVLIHGITAPAFVCKYVAKDLVAAGFRVLLYDLYGRGWSEAPEVVQDANLYILQLATLLQYIRWHAADIVGFSMGGAIAAAFAATFPYLVRENVVFLAAAGLMDRGNVLSGATAPAPEANPEEIARVNDAIINWRTLQFEHLPGAKRTFEACRTDGLLTDIHWGYDTIGKAAKKRFLIIHGTADRIVPFNEALKIKKYIPQAKLVPINGASHYLVLEGGPEGKEVRQQVIDAIIPFLEGSEGRRSKF